MKVSAILPVFNEKERVGKIVEVLEEADFVDEAIFVDNGSKDESFEFLKRLENKKIKVFGLKRNHGKGFALSFGINRARGEILIFIDSDLIGLKKEHLKTLILPLLKEKKRCAIGVPLEKDRKIFRPWEFWLSGERVYFKKDLLPHLEKISKLRHGVELYLDSIFEPEEIKVVRLVSLISPSKFEKKEFFEAWNEYFKEAKEIFEDLAKIKINYQFAKNLIKSYIKEIVGVWLSGRTASP
jgi:glycosyltransferase involved in cell wall biosynthesis